MKSRIRKPVFFVVFFLIAAFTVLSTMGISTRYGDTVTSYVWGLDDIRWGIDIRGGVNATFGVPEDYAAEHDITEDDLSAAKSILEARLVSKHINDYEVYVDSATNSIILQFPWQSDDTSFDPAEAVKEIGETALLTFRMGWSGDIEADGTYEDLELVLTGSDVSRAGVGRRPSDTGGYIYTVDLELNESGREAFAKATETAYNNNQSRISIWMDDVEISAPSVSAVITDGKCEISGSFETAEDAKALADKINGGALPFKLDITSLSTISPILGSGARDAMALAGLIAFILIAIFMIAYYRLPGFVAVIALTGQVAGMFAAITGFFAFNDESIIPSP